MRIISGRDYYDSAMAFGHDESITFVRQKNHVCDNNYISQGHIYPPILDIRLHRDESQYLYVDRVFNIIEDGYPCSVYMQAIKVIVCGKSYNGIQICNITNSAKTHNFWCKDDLLEWTDSHKFKVRFYANWKRSTDKQVDQILVEYFEPKAVTKDSLDWLIDNNVTVLTYVPVNLARDKFWWKINGDNLKQLQFYKAVDPYTLFQEIEMWVGGVLPRSGNPMVQITDDNIKVAKHGFDKWSFRKQSKASGI